MKFTFGKVTALDQVPEAFRSLYTDKPEADGNFVLRPEFAQAGQAFNGLNEALNAERTSHNATRGRLVDLSGLSEYGSSPDEIKQKFTALLEDATKGGKVNVDNIRKEVASSMSREFDTMKTRNSALQSQLYDLLVTNSASAALTQPETRGSVDLLLPVITKQVKVSDADGKFTVNVVDGQNNIRYSGVTGLPMTIPELVAEMKGNSVYSMAFYSDAQSGAGKPPTGERPVPPIQTSGTGDSAVDLISAGLADRARRR